MSRYAKNTGVSVERTKGEIERTLARYGAQQFVSGWDQDRAVLGFVVENKQVKFSLPLPDRNADEFRLTPARGNERHPADAAKAWEQACRQRWRALALCIKAKLEAVAAGITTFEQEFLAHIVIPGTRGQTLGQMMIPKITDAYEGKTVNLLEWKA